MARGAVDARCHAIDLTRENWSGRAALGWAPAELYADLASRPADFLGPRELDTYQRFEYERRRTTYLLGRYAAKLAVTRLAEGVDPRAIDVVPGCFQQPIVSGPVGAPLGVSISHSARAACAIAFPAGHPMGIDVEEIDAARAAVMKTQLVGRELTAFAAIADEPTLAAIMWTAKEALSKALQCGMTVPFELLEVDALERRGADVTGVFRNFAQYRFQSRIRDGAIVSLVLPKRTELAADPQFLS